MTNHQSNYKLATYPYLVGRLFHIVSVKRNNQLQILFRKKVIRCYLKVGTIAR